MEAHSTVLEPQPMMNVASPGRVARDDQHGAEGNPAEEKACRRVAPEEGCRAEGKERKRAEPPSTQTSPCFKAEEATASSRLVLPACAHSPPSPSRCQWGVSLSLPLVVQQQQRGERRATPSASQSALKRVSSSASHSSASSLSSRSHSRALFQDVGEACQLDAGDWYASSSRSDTSQVYLHMVGTRLVHVACVRCRYI